MNAQALIETAETLVAVDKVVLARSTQRLLLYPGREKPINPP
ncbi:MAG: hypothetical protein ABIQ87_18180 [Rubrivivax sp.]